MKIYVDCDDTLILHIDREGNVLDGEHPMGDGAYAWVLNLKLIEQLKAFVRRYNDIEIVVWSGGGYQYAGIWMEAAFFEDYRRNVGRWAEGILMEQPSKDLPFKQADPPFNNIRIVATSKNELGFRLVNKGDIVIDDMVLSIPCDPLLLTPEDFIAKAPRMVVK